jgi:ectoine hydroxylase-related dioxygenase (phytanoyl-CoA dioxygenase family)
MQWFKRARRKDVWDEAIEGPFGDIEAAKRIRDICSSAADSAEKVGAAADRTHRKIKGDVERYERAARAAMETAMEVSDELLRDAAVRQIVELCLKAGNLTTAQTLLRAIQTKSIRDDVLREFPQLQ